MKHQVKNTKFFNFVIRQLVKNNRIFNKYVDKRSNITQEERNTIIEKIEQERIFWERIEIWTLQEDQIFGTPKLIELKYKKTPKYKRPTNIRNEDKNWETLQSFNGTLQITY